MSAETINLGLGFDIQHDGHGFDLHKVDNTYILFFYTYDDDGNPEWFLGVGDMADGVIRGSLDRFIYDAQAKPRQVVDPSFSGSFSLDWRTAAVEGACNDGATRSGAKQLASFYWKTGARSGAWCTQFLFGGDAGENPYHGGVWFAGEDDAGYGFSMSQQGATKIAIVYYYDTEGQPRWALGGGEAGGVIELDNYKGYCRTCTPVERELTLAGTLALDWDNGSAPGSGADLAELALTYPLDPFGDFDRDFILSRLSDGAPQDDITLAEMPVEDFYQTHISDFIIQQRCVNCHIEGGRSGHTRLVFKRSSEADDRAMDLAQITALAEEEGADYILNKIRGALGHGGGIQVPADEPEYADMVLLFGLMNEDINNSGDTKLFDNVELLPWDKTFRRAALIFAGRLPTEGELATARGGTETEVRAMIRDLMTGGAFHEFLIEGANDRLLTDKWLEDNFVDAANQPYYPEYKRLIAENIELVYSLPEDQRHEAWERVSGNLRRATAREPLELIADVVENEEPYTRIVTADYTMVNPLLAEAYKSDTVFDNPDDPNEWRRGSNHGQLLIDDTYQEERLSIGDATYSRYLGGGIPFDMPHSGVLNTPAFLARYPSTATNRNRARSRWTYYFFLGVNIEKLASRTQDPDALADKNNPTMNNPSCTVCHVVMDPVAGSFQNYGDVGVYRNEWGGNDSLPDTYKWSVDSPYQPGDTWYRDMRKPGFGPMVAPNPDNSLQWLGQLIAEDPRFATGAVKFWWPALFGRLPLESPEESSDADFAAKLLAFETQNMFIESVAADFRTGLSERGPYNLKDLLVELVMSPWFRASGLTASVSEEQMLALEAGYVGAEKLLTPEQLDRKTEAITGYVWQQYEDVLGERRSGLRDHYRMYYGGIDSDGINQRSAEITSVMSNVVAAMAAESACPIMITEILKPDSLRQLLAGWSELDAPIFEAAAIEPVAVEGFGERQDYILDVTLEPGDKRIRVQFLNDFATDADGDRNLYVSGLEVKNAAGQVVRAFDLSRLDSLSGLTRDENVDCNRQLSDRWAFYCEGFVEVPLSVTTQGEYTITVQAFGDQAGPEVIQMLSMVLDTDPFGQSAGAIRIRDRLSQWHERFFGEAVSANSEEVAAVYEFLVETWLRNSGGDIHWLDGNYQSCRWYEEISDEDGARLYNDPLKMAGTWRLVLTYFLTDYRYIFE